MITIHHLQRSQSERIPWLCEELSIPYTLKLYQRSPLLSPPELQALTPLGAAPVIEVGTDPSTTTSSPPASSNTTLTATTSSSSEEKSLKLAESAAIVDYLIHKHGGGRLSLPPTHPNYADYLYFFHLANGNLQPCAQRCMHIKLLKLPGGADHPAQKAVDARLAKVLNVLDRRLSQVPWLAGQEFTAADIMSVFTVTTMRLFYPYSLEGYQGILAWLQRIAARPAYRTAREKSDPGFDPVVGAEEPTPFPGMYQ